MATYTCRECRRYQSARQYDAFLPVRAAVLPYQVMLNTVCDCRIHSVPFDGLVNREKRLWLLLEQTDEKNLIGGILHQLICHHNGNVLRAPGSSNVTREKRDMRPRHATSPSHDDECLDCLWNLDLRAAALAFHAETHWLEDITSKWSTGKVADSCRTHEPKSGSKIADARK